MGDNKMQSFIRDVLQHMPSDWLNLTTHRLDIYNEKLAKIQFLDKFEHLFQDNKINTASLSKLPTAYDYIRLGHPLSCFLEWVIANKHNLPSENVISFSSESMPILAILRKNSLENRNTQIVYKTELPESFQTDILQDIYGYRFHLQQVDRIEDISKFNGSTVYISNHPKIEDYALNPNVDFFINIYRDLGSVILINGKQNKEFIRDIQHVRRRETIAMTPANCLIALKAFETNSNFEYANTPLDVHKDVVLTTIKSITNTNTKALVASSGLSIQYAILMGLIDHALENHPNKEIKIIVPPNCYGGTNDQARRVAKSIDKVEILDLSVDGGNDMVQGVEKILDKVADLDAVPFIIAEIPTNPRVEVPDLIQLQKALSKQRKTPNGNSAVEPVFILDQTFCPNVHFLGEDGILSKVKTISFASGSKFPSGGLCTAGYCIGNEISKDLVDKIEVHLKLCDNEATPFQYEILAQQLPSMIQRIQDAYQNTRDFVNFIHQSLPSAKINFVSEELASQGFTPSVFSLDLPTKGNSDEEREAYKRALNLKLINLMITRIPTESKNCVSYGQLKGCYWTIPATSTQGTTKEGDKDYIARVSVSPQLDLELHKKVFQEFVDSL